ncbi:beta-microseminoprotein-like [Corythoichthys intestinalis]|uniref:beta-microseminoprotein-like n=1 Tax=Corythoichthys intestinalis TaxID=161448 RepID=UPI0025A5DAE6|nr:beta-microseminoprotein-like [Corythoichthys intestinalis]
MNLVATMRTYLSLAVLLCTLLPLSNAFCEYKRLEDGATDCLDEVDNKWHPVGSYWINSDCMNCTCTTCCSVFSIPKRFPDDCVSVFDKVACKYKVHKIDDPSTECPIFASVF